jgi:hypothetical protein
VDLRLTLPGLVEFIVGTLRWFLKKGIQCRKQKEPLRLHFGILNYIFEIKFVIFSKKLLCKVSIFFIRRLASSLSEKEEKRGDCHLKNILTTS